MKKRLISNKTWVLLTDIFCIITALCIVIMTISFFAMFIWSYMYEILKYSCLGYIVFGSLTILSFCKGNIWEEINKRVK
jgi:hypothetical protein